MTSQHFITTQHFPAIAYTRQGSGPPIMLLHGFPATGSLWSEVLPGLSQTLTVLVPDIPGTGSSRLEGESTSIEALAGIVPAILADAGLDRCVLAGHSMGGYISLAAGALYGERIQGLSLVHSSALADDEEKKIKRAKSIALIRKGAKDTFVSGMIPGLFSEAFKKAHPEAIDRQISEGIKIPAETLIAFYNAMIERPDRLEVLRGAGFPVQWILGTDDITIPWESCLQQIPLANVSFIERYAHCGHMSMIEQKDLLQEDLLKFVEYCNLNEAEGSKR